MERNQPTEGRRPRGGEVIRTTYKHEDATMIPIVLYANSKFIKKESKWKVCKKRATSGGTLDFQPYPSLASHLSQLLFHLSSIKQDSQSLTHWSEEV